METWVKKELDIIRQHTTDEQRENLQSLWKKGKIKVTEVDRCIISSLTGIPSSNRSIQGLSYIREGGFFVSDIEYYWIDNKQVIPSHIDYLTQITKES